MVGLEDLIQGEAEMGDESDDESFDEETGDVRRKSNGAKRQNGNLDDSSEEESDDDEEAARAVSDMCPTPSRKVSNLLLPMQTGPRGLHRRR